MPEVKPKILVVVESLDVNDSSGTKGRVALINNLAKAGFDLDVLHYTQKEVQLPGVKCISVLERKGTPMFFLSRVQRLLYRWFKVDIGRKVDGMFGFSFGFFNDVSSLKNAIKKFDPKDYEMIWAFGKGTSFRPHAAIYKLPQWHSKLYAFVHDPYPMHLYPRPYNYIEAGYRAKRLFFKAFSEKAHRMVFPSLLLKEWMQSYYRPIAGKALIVPHQIASIEMNEVPFPEYFDPKKFNLLHAGNLLDLRDPKPVVEAFSLFLKNHPEAAGESSLIFLGKESIYDTYLHNQQKSIPQLYASKGYVAFEEVFLMQQNASANIILEAKSEISPFLPGKFAHCVGADSPIILVGPYYSECRRLLGEDYQYRFDFSEIEKMAEGFANLYLKWKQNNGALYLDRPDLQHYLSAAYLKETIQKKTPLVSKKMKILFVSIRSIHFIRWASQLKDSGHDVYWFDVANGGNIAQLNWVSQHTNWRYKLGKIRGRTYFKKHWPGLHRFLENNIEKEFEKFLKAVKPDVVHSLVMYKSCTPIFPVMQKYRQLKWIYSSWGSDLFYFKNLPLYRKDIETVLPRIDYLFTDNNRDHGLAREMGFQGEHLGVFPGGGGFHIENFKDYVKPIQERKIILVKGYQGRSGRAIAVLEALATIEASLEPFEIVVFGADPEVISTIKDNPTLKRLIANIYTRKNQLSHPQVLELMGKSLLYIGNSNSDGMPNTLLEAIIMGAFPIQSNPGGVTSEIITHGLNGFLIEDETDVEGIKDLILKSIDAQVLLSSAFEMNQELRNKFNFDEIKEKVMQAYASIEVKTIAYD